MRQCTGWVVASPKGASLQCHVGSWHAPIPRISDALSIKAMVAQAHPGARVYAVLVP